MYYLCCIDGYPKVIYLATASHLKRNCNLNCFTFQEYQFLCCSEFHNWIVCQETLDDGVLIAFIMKFLMYSIFIKLMKLISNGMLKACTVKTNKQWLSFCFNVYDESLSWVFICVPCALRCLWRPEQGIRCPGSRITEVCKPLCGCWELSPGQLLRIASDLNYPYL